MKVTLLTVVALLLAAISQARAGWARVEGGKVVELFSSMPDFHPDVMARILPCPDNVGLKWRFAAGVWSPPKTEAEIARDAFNTMRATARGMADGPRYRFLREQLTHKLDGPLSSGYPNLAQPMYTNALGAALSLVDFEEYIQERVDAEASSQEIKALNDAAKAARIYLRSLK